MGIDFVTVLDAILTRRQPRAKLQCLCENLKSNNFRKTAVPKKYETKATKQKIELKTLGAYPVRVLSWIQ